MGHHLRLRMLPWSAGSGWVYALATVPNPYRIEPAGTQFRVIDPEGEQVGTYSSEADAQQDMERCEKQYAMVDTAKLLVNIAVKTHMLMHGVDRETALFSLRING
jgi:uncharacterized protein YcgI (DUF1989 family)